MRRKTCHNPRTRAGSPQTGRWFGIIPARFDRVFSGQTAHETEKGSHDYGKMRILQCISDHGRSATAINVTATTNARKALTSCGWPTLCRLISSSAKWKPSIAVIAPSAIFPDRWIFTNSTRSFLRCADAVDDEAAALLLFMRSQTPGWCDCVVARGRLVGLSVRADPYARSGHSKYHRDVFSAADLATFCQSSPSGPGQYRPANVSQSAGQERPASVARIRAA
jgi:hypothetical protein